MLHDLLTKYKLLSIATLGNWKNKPVDIQQKKEANPYHTNTYPVLREHKPVLKK